MAVNVKMGVDIGGFTSGIREGQQILKGLNAEMKASDAAFKATGNAEQKLNSQTKTLNSTLNVQKGIADQARQALDAMTKAGVDPASAAYQKMYVTLMNAEAGANEAQAALNQLGAGTAQAADGAEQLTKGLNGISKKISLDQVISGIDKITGGLENAAKKAIQLGEDLWNTIMDSASRADDTATMAEMYGIDLDTFQRMQKLVTGGMDTSVEAMLRSQKKLRKGIGDGSKEVQETLSELGITVKEWQTVAGQSGSALITKDQTKLFWEAGQAILNMGDAYDKESAAQRLFGRSWEELVPLFKEYKTLEEYNAALEDQTVNTEETIRDLAALNDAVGKLEGSWTTLKDELIGTIAPELTGAADAVSGLLNNLTEYLKTDDGKKMLEDLGTAVSGLFEDLGKIDPASVVEGFTGVFKTVVDSVKWLVNNKDSVINALEGIVIGWGALKLTGGALQILNLINGLKGLGLGGGGATGGAATGGSAAAGGTASTAGITAGEIAQTALFASPFVLFADGMIRDQQLLNEFMKKGEEKQAEYQQAVKDFSGSEMFDIWDTLTRYTTINGSPAEDNAKMDAFVSRFFSWWNDETTDVWLEELTGAMTDEQLYAFRDAMEQVKNGELLYSTEDQQDFADAMNAAIEAAKSLMKPVDVKVQAEPNSAEELAKQIGSVKVPATFVFSIPGFANGIHSVPYDGMLARLHKGERVVPAREIASRSYNSNLYVESMIMNNGTDAAGLAAAMAAAQRRTMSGYGS